MEFRGSFLRNFWVFAPTDFLSLRGPWVLIDASITLCLGDVSEKKYLTSSAKLHRMYQKVAGWRLVKMKFFRCIYKNFIAVWRWSWAFGDVCYQNCNIHFCEIFFWTDFTLSDVCLKICNIHFSVEIFAYKECCRLMFVNE